jgi:methionyl aminopeptidase
MEVIIIKNKKQINGIRKSCKLASATLSYIEPYLKAGITTEYLDTLLESFIRDNNAIPAPLGYKGYPKASCISVNEVVCHGIPGEYVLKNGDIVTIDVTTILEGYYGDKAITYSIGEISHDAEFLMRVTKKCLQIGINQVIPGRMTGMIGHHISSYALLQGYSIVEQFCGHGVGVEFHEPPHIMHICKMTDGVIMYPGMIFTIEPMICLKAPDVVIMEDGWTVVTADGGLCAQFEDTILVTEKGCEILT